MIQGTFDFDTTEAIVLTSKQKAQIRKLKLLSERQLSSISRFEKKVTKLKQDYLNTISHISAIQRGENV